MVVTFLPPTIDIWVWQDLTALPSIWTVQAPHRPEPQPYLVPVSFRCSRTTQTGPWQGRASRSPPCHLFEMRTPALASSLANGSPYVRYVPAESPNGSCFLDWSEGLHTRCGSVARVLLRSRSGLANRRRPLENGL